MTRAIGLLCALILTAAPALAEVVVAKRTIRAQAILTAADLELRDLGGLAGLTDLSALIGLETRQILYAGRPIPPDAVGPPAIVDRNALVTLVYAMGGVEIATDGRALGRAAQGEPVRVMNLSSRNTVTGHVLGPNLVSVAPTRLETR